MDLTDLTIVTTTQPELLVSQLGEYQVSVANLNGSCEVIKSFKFLNPNRPLLQPQILQ